MRNPVLDEMPVAIGSPASVHLHWKRTGKQVSFMARQECAVVFDNPAFFGKTFVHLDADKTTILDVVNDSTPTDFFVLGLTELRTAGDPPPIT